MSVYINDGFEIKDLGNGSIGGYAVRFGSPEDPDLAGDFFTCDTNFYIKEDNLLPVFYAHSFDAHFQDTVLGEAKFRKDATGVWVEAQLNLRDEYEKAVYELVKKGKLGWSTGAPGHLVRREKVKQANFIKSWPIAEVSLTPTPAEPKTFACIKEIEVAQVSSSIRFEESSSRTLHEHFDSCLLDLKSLTNRLDSVKTLRENKGRKAFTQTHLEMLQQLSGEIADLKHAAEVATGLWVDPEVEARKALLDDLYKDLGSIIFEDLKNEHQ